MRQGAMRSLSRAVGARVKVPHLERTLALFSHFDGCQPARSGDDEGDIRIVIVPTAGSGSSLSAVTARALGSSSSPTEGASQGKRGIDGSTHSSLCRLCPVDACDRRWGPRRCFLPARRPTSATASGIWSGRVGSRWATLQGSSIPLFSTGFHLAVKGGDLAASAIDEGTSQGHPSIQTRCVLRAVGAMCWRDVHRAWSRPFYDQRLIELLFETKQRSVLRRWSPRCSPETSFTRAAEVAQSRSAAATRPSSPCPAGTDSAPRLDLKLGVGARSPPFLVPGCRGHERAEAAEVMRALEVVRAAAKEQKQDPPRLSEGFNCTARIRFVPPATHARRSSHFARGMEAQKPRLAELENWRKSRPRRPTDRRALGRARSCRAGDQRGRGRARGMRRGRVAHEEDVRHLERGSPCADSAAGGGWPRASRFRAISVRPSSRRAWMDRLERCLTCPVLPHRSQPPSPRRRSRRSRPRREHHTEAMGTRDATRKAISRSTRSARRSTCWRSRRWRRS